MSVLGTQIISSQIKENSFLSIPAHLKENANAVVRNDETEVILNSISRLTVKHRRIVTVLNEDGNSAVKLHQHYNNDSKVTAISAIIYDAFGTKIKKYSKSKFSDVSAVPGGTLYSDARLLYVNHTPTSYPYTVVFESEYTTSSTGFVNGWFPLSDFLISVEKSSYKLVNKTTIDVRKNESNFEGFPIISTSTEEILSYAISNQKAIKYERSAGGKLSFFPRLQIALNEFSLKGVQGRAGNWKEFGQWEHDVLLKGRDILNSATVNEVQNLVKGLNDPIEKAKRVYQYMQDKTRYISVQVGIGGWEPIPANEVDLVGYGDCKGLTNYTKALMDAVGVTSYYTLVYANEKRNIDAKFASLQGNHAILNIPIEGEDIWLECTSQTIPFGFLGDFTDDRDVLVVTPEGGVIKRTSNYKNEQNLQKSIATVAIDSIGSVKAEIQIISSGIQYDQKYQLDILSLKDRKEYYTSSYWDNLNNLTLHDIQLLNNREDVIFTEKIKLSIKEHASLTSNEMLLLVNVFNKNTHVPKRYRNRSMPLKIERGYQDIDESIIEIPKGYKVGTLFDDISIINKFGVYRISIHKIDENHLKYKRTLLIKEGVYPKEEYASYRSFRRKVAKNDRTRITFKKA